MKIHSKKFRVPPGKKIDLKGWPTIVKPFCKSKKQYQGLLEKQVEELSSLQQLHYASNRYALLLVFQGIDAAGKDGAIRHVMSGINPQGCDVFSFKQPSVEELEHDFLWRATYRLPERGRIAIFNRSYYEEVLVVRVHPEILRNEGLSEELRDEKTIWTDRYRSIVDLEEHLHRNGTRIIKFFLHLSKDEQRKRFLERIDEPDKNWKFSLADIHERRSLASMMEVFEAQLPTNAIDDYGTTTADWVTVQIGGDAVYRGNGTVMTDGQVVGKSTVGGDVTAKLIASRDGVCRGAKAANDREQALRLFSPSACGAYGFENLKIAHAGRRNPIGQIILESDKNVRLLAGSGLLLRVTTPE